MSLEVELVKGSDLFKSLNPKAQELLASKLVPHSYISGELILKKGEPGSSMFILSKGVVDVHDNELTLATFSKGDYFGEFSLLDNQPRSLSITAKSEVLLYQLKQEDFYSSLETDPASGRLLIKSLVSHLRKRNDKTISELKERERVLSELVEQRTAEIEEKKKVLELRNKEILDSISYAKRHQDARIPKPEQLKEILINGFILYKPKDIVAGDFYWFENIRGKSIIVCADCTGHGVAGALMSMLGLSLLDEIVIKNDISNPAEILNQLHDGVFHSMHQEKGENSDGMDIIVCTYDQKNKTLEYAGANRPLCLIRNGELQEFKTDKFPIGGSQHLNRQPFQSFNLELKSSDCIYLYSDGYADQFGGPEGKKMMKKRLREQLLNVHQLSQVQQKDKLNKYFIDWKKDEEQVDDVLLIGLNFSNLEELEDIYKLIKDSAIFFSYQGDIDLNILNKAYGTVEERLEILEFDSKRKKRFYHIVVEGLQNMYHHMYKPEGSFESGNGYFVIGMNQNEQLSLITGNYIEEKDVPRLRENIEKVNSMSPEDLRTAYRQQLSEGELSLKGTAGLGLIDLTRKSRNKIDYAFTDKGKGLYFFKMIISV